jgi:hypothetical protein
MWPTASKVLAVARRRDCCRNWAMSVASRADSAPRETAAWWTAWPKEVFLSIASAHAERSTEH